MVCFSEIQQLFFAPHPSHFSLTPSLLLPSSCSSQACSFACPLASVAGGISRECFCFCREAVNTSGEAVRALVKSRVEIHSRLRRSLARSRIPPATQATCPLFRSVVWSPPGKGKETTATQATGFSKNFQKKFTYHLSPFRKFSEAGAGIWKWIPTQSFHWEIRTSMKIQCTV